MSDEMPKRRGRPPKNREVAHAPSDANSTEAPAPVAEPVVEVSHEQECEKEPVHAVALGYEMKFRCVSCKYVHTEVGMVYRKTYCAKCDMAMGIIDKKKVG